jgi:hypothetical protein
MTSFVGRPALPGFSTTLRLTPSAAEIADTGAALLAEVTDKAVSRAAWVRKLIEHTFENYTVEHTATPDQLKELWADLTPSPDSQRKVTIKLEERQRVLLRQFECHVQSFDWSIEFTRNEAVLLLLVLHGPLFNKLLVNQLRHLQAKKRLA